MEKGSGKLNGVDSLSVLDLSLLFAVNKRLSHRIAMADDSLDQTPKADGDNVDLSSLSSFSLGPDWVSGKKPQTRLPKEAFEDDRKGPHGPRKDRRGGLARKRPSFDRDRKDRPPRRERHDREERKEPFKPILAVDFYPEEEPFKVLSQAIKTSCRTFELFEIARLILEKPDRFVCVARDPLHKDGESAKLWACVPDGLPFQSEEEAMAHTFRHYLSEFFTLETVEVDPPAGSFQMVHRCGITHELLAPPNYHRYQAICREHHAAKLSHVPYSRFEQRIESTREEEDIQAWLTGMKTQTRYISKENPEHVFENREDARLYLVTQAKDKLVRPAYSARFSGKTLALLNPGSPIRRSVEFLLEGQKRFPLETANHLRGRLRRMHFAVYKRGSKGVSYVCAVKRHFRKPDEVLADNLQKLVAFLEEHANFPAKDLPRAFLQIESEEGNAPAIKQLKTDLHYLVSQGYVIEYSDGKLFVPPIREDEIRHLEKLKAQDHETGKSGHKEATDAKPESKISPEKPEADPLEHPEDEQQELKESESPQTGEPVSEDKPVAAEDAAEGPVMEEQPEVKPAEIQEETAKPDEDAAVQEPDDAEAEEAPAEAVKPAAEDSVTEENPAVEENPAEEEKPAADESVVAVEEPVVAEETIGETELEAETPDAIEPEKADVDSESPEPVADSDSKNKE